MGEATERHVGRFPRQLRYPFEFRGDVHGGLRLRHLSLQRFHDTVPPFARRGPSGRFPRVCAPIAALRLPAPPLRSLALRSAVPPSGGGDGASQVPGGPSRTCPALGPRWDRSVRPLGPCPTYWTLRCCLPLLGRRRLPQICAISRLYHAACTLAVYASRPRLPVCCLRPRKPRFRLVARLGRAGFEPAGSHREVSACSSTWRPPHPGLAWRTLTAPGASLREPGERRLAEGAGAPDLPQPLVTHERASGSYPLPVPPVPRAPMPRPDAALSTDGVLLRQRARDVRLEGRLRG